MRRRFSLLTLVLVYSLAPGVHELIESAFHYVETGHDVHVHANLDSGSPDDRCQGYQHLCLCFGSSGFEPSQTPALEQNLSFVGTLAFDTYTAPASDDLSGRVFRPPRVEHAFAA